MGEISRHLLTTVVDTSPDAILVLDSQYHIIAANQQATAIFRYESSNDLIGTNVLALVTADDASRTQAEINSVNISATEPMSEFMAQRADVSTFQAEMHLAPVRNSQGHTGPSPV